MMHRAGWSGPVARSAMAFAWFVWDRDHHGPTEFAKNLSHTGFDGSGPNAVIIGDEVMNDDEKVVNNDERRTLVNLKREVEFVQNTVEEAMHQLVRRIDAHISATGERRRYHPQPPSWPLRPPGFRPSVFDDLDEIELETGPDDAGSKSSL